MYICILLNYNIHICFRIVSHQLALILETKTSFKARHTVYTANKSITIFRFKTTLLLNSVGCCKRICGRVNDIEMK